MGLWGEGRGQGSAGGRTGERDDTGRKLLEEKREINGRGGERRDKEEEGEEPDEVFWWRGREMEGGREEGRRRNK